MVFPIEHFGFKLCRTFIDSNDKKSYEFGKNNVTFCIKEGDTYDYEYFHKFLSLEDDSFTEALQETIKMIGDKSYDI